MAEEIKSKEGEVIGLFLQEYIPPKLSFDETLSRIKEQGALVYVPHPFDALRTTPTYQALVDNLHRIDVIEIYNAKVALSSFNLSAERFAAKYNIVAGAGSDAHVLQALGTAMLRMPKFARSGELHGGPVGGGYHRPPQEPALSAVAQAACTPLSTGSCPRSRRGAGHRPRGLGRIAGVRAGGFLHSPANIVSMNDSQPLTEATEIYRKLEERAIKRQ